MIQFGLVGNNISKSLSKEIHEHVLGSKYELLQMENEKEFLLFLKTDFKFINITKPYKEIAYQSCDVLDEVSEATKVVNLIIKKDGKLYGYNTDAFGFEKLLEKYSISIDGKECLILGTGATAKTVCYVLKKLHAKSTTFVSRKNACKNAITYNDISKAKNAHIIINCTTVGAFEIEETDVLIKDVSLFENIETYIDVNYMPFRSSQALLFKNNNVKVISGLYMLVAQALKSDEIYTTKVLTKHDIKHAYKHALGDNFNIVLIGHPLPGKTTIAQELAKKMDVTLVDTDKMAELISGKTIPQIFKEDGEKAFRTLETEIIKMASECRGQIISTGGGIVLNPDNIELLSRNSVFINIKRDLSTIDEKDIINRPLCKCKNDLYSLIKEREVLYHKYADIEVINSSLEETVKMIGDLLWESRL